MQGNVLGQSNNGSNFINGIIEEYKVAAGENINAGDFVKFTNDKCGVNTELTVANTKAIGGRAFAVLVDTNKIFIIYHTYYREQTSDNSYTVSSLLSGVVCTIDGTTITVGTDKILKSNGILNNGLMSAILVDTNKVFILYFEEHSVSQTNYDECLCGLVCTIEGTEITVGTSTKLAETRNENHYTASAVLIENNKVFIAYDYWEYGYNYDTYTEYLISLSLRGIICTIEGKEIAVEGHKILKSSSEIYYGKVKAVLVDINKVCLILEYNATAYQRLKGLVCIIDGTEITAGTIVDLLELSTFSKFLTSVISTDINKLFITVARNFSTPYSGTNDISAIGLYGVVCTIDGAEITVGEPIFLKTVNTNKTTVRALSASLVQSDEIFIVFDCNNLLYRIICTISGTSIEMVSDMQLISNLLQNTTISATSSVLIDKNKVFIANGYAKTDESAYRVCGIVNYTNNINKANKWQSNILGIAKNSGTEGDTIKVIVPE